ncbi:hypothetical protein L1987_79623 [Smallanthus sonchifolius]|uniref:Uncharacterized protein n=1 Tax=Smallanthus sonchifolius TaxID=185202 RepID=A0ACB8YKW0_9ASTR|nr:hypothetical protein L1987_79623 [Smallanthus sonchifolius]
MHRNKTRLGFPSPLTFSISIALSLLVAFNVGSSWLIRVCTATTYSRPSLALQDTHIERGIRKGRRRWR